MITTADVRDWLKTVFVTAEHFYVGRLDNKQQKSVGVYTLAQSGAPVTAIGQDSSYTTIGISCLIHWNENAKETEIAANVLYEVLRTVKNVTINGHNVYMIELLVPEPQDVDTDDNGVYERVIEFLIYYERK